MGLYDLTTVKAVWEELSCHKTLSIHLLIVYCFLFLATVNAFFLSDVSVIFKHKFVFLFRSLLQILQLNDKMSVFGGSQLAMILYIPGIGIERKVSSWAINLQSETFLISYKFLFLCKLCACGVKDSCLGNLSMWTAACVWCKSITAC